MRVHFDSYSHICPLVNSMVPVSSSFHVVTFLVAVGDILYEQF